MMMLAVGATAQISPKATKPSHSFLQSKKEEVNQKIKTLKAQQKATVDHIPGKGTFYTWDTTSQDWLFDYSSTYQYNPAHQVTSEVQTDEDGLFTQRITTTYNANGAPLQAETEGWFNNKWNPGYKSVYMYNSHDELVQYEELFYMPGEWIVVFGLRNNITYHPVSGAETWIMSYWDGTQYVEEQMIEIEKNAQGLHTIETISAREDSGWYPVMQNEYSYNTASNTTEMIRSLHNGSDFFRFEKMISVYETQPQAEDRPLSITYETWNAGTWVSSRKFTYTYDSFGSYDRVEEVYTGGWQNNARNRERVDRNGNQLQSSYETWNGSQWEIMFDNQYTLSYDAEENLTERILSVSNDIGFLQPRTREVYEEFPVSTGIGQQEALSLTAYPNPVKEQLQLRLADALTGELSVTLRDMTGRTVYRQNFNGNAVAIDMSTYPHGIYILEVSTKEKNSMIKIVKQ